MARENAIPNLYLGRLIFEADGTEKQILMLIEVESREALFDVQVKIPKKFLYILPGDELIASISIFNLERVGMVDVNLEYIIIDSEGKIIISEKESLAVETRIEFLKYLNIPKELKRGRYVLYVKTIYDNKTASASAWFNVEPEAKPLSIIYKILYLQIGILVVLIVLMIIILSNKRNNKNNSKCLFLHFILL